MQNTGKRLLGIRKREEEEPGLEAFGWVTEERKPLWLEHRTAPSWWWWPYWGECESDVK